MSDTANNTTAYDSMSKPEQEAFDAEARAKEASEQAGQCSATHVRNSYAHLAKALPYRWTQDLDTVTVSVSLPQGTRGKDCVVVMEKRKLKVQVKGSDPILEGELFNEISKDDSSWTIRRCCITACINE